ncbi:MAG: hypothetical protein H6586_04460 [Flavobacteriales bacterium]|nr:hypothetical protein [Flavobacteriales bacterium]
MRLFTLLVLLLILNVGSIKAQVETDSTEYLIGKLIDKINELPRTNVFGQGDFKFQSKYSLDWNKKTKTLTLIDKRFRPNSEDKLSDEYITDFKIEALHTKGVFMRSLLQDNNLSLQILTANNDKKIQNLTYENGKYRFGIYNDRITIGSWDSLLINNQLNTIKELFDKIITLNTNWDATATPDITKIVMPEIIQRSGFKYSTITYEQDDDSPLFLNSTIEEPALFLDSKTDQENSDKIKNYIIEQIDKRGLKMKGVLSGSIIISKSGAIEDFKSFNMNKPKIEQEVKEIILSMPHWKVGKHKGDNVRTDYTIFIKK